MGRGIDTGMIINSSPRFKMIFINPLSGKSKVGIILMIIEMMGYSHIFINYYYHHYYYSIVSV